MISAEFEQCNILVTYLAGSPELSSYFPMGAKALVVYLLVVLGKKMKVYITVLNNAYYKPGSD